MPAIGLKIVGTEAFLPWCSISSFFKTVWRCLGIKVMSFWSFDVGILSHCCLLLVYSCWRFFDRLCHIFCLMMHQMFSICERSGLQAGRFSIQTILLLSHAVVKATVWGFALPCWNKQGLPWNTCHLEGSICCSKTFIYLPAFIVPSKTCKLPIPYALMHPHTIRDSGFWT